MTARSSSRFHVVILGGGVAGLEAALALRDLAGERTAVTMIAPEEEFIYRPMRVREPFAEPLARRYPLKQIAEDVGFTHVQDKVRWVDPTRRIVHTEGDEQHAFDALVMALGTQKRARFPHALTLDDRTLDEQLHGLIQDVEEGYVRSLAFALPAPTPWPLPIYELALMTARRAWEMDTVVRIALATPEDAPLAVFGTPASEAVAKLLAEHDIAVFTSAYCETPEPGTLSMSNSPEPIHADRIVTLPQLYGPAVPGIPRTAPGGFIEVDAHGKLKTFERIYAAGDATSFPLKHGGLAAQQADVVAQAIAALAGADVTPEPFEPIVRAMLIGGDQPLYMEARVTGRHGANSRVSTEPLWSPPNKIAAKYLGPYLESRDRSSVR